jgi:hypothetical protein
MAIEIGSRVQVAIKGTDGEDKWHRDAMEAFEGKCGEVESFSVYSSCYVIFDEPAERWAMRSSEGSNKITGWHFSKLELKELDDRS